MNRRSVLKFPQGVFPGATHVAISWQEAGPLFEQKPSAIEGVPTQPEVLYRIATGEAERCRYEVRAGAVRERQEGSC